MSDPTPPAPPSPSASVDAPAPPTPPAGRPRRRRRWGRRLLAGLGVVLLLLVVTLALLPTLLSTGPGTAAVARLARGSVDGDVRIGNLSVGWFSPTRVEGLVIDDPAGRRALDADVTSDLTLLGALRGGLGGAGGVWNVGETVLNLNAPIVLVDADGRTNWHDLLRLDPEAEPADDPTRIPDVRGTIRVNGMATVQHTGFPADDGTPGPPAPPVQVTYDDTRLVLEPGRPVEQQVRLALRVAGQPAGQIDADGTVDLTTDAPIPPLVQTLTLADVDLAAVSPILTALGVYEGTLAGRVDGTFDADTTANTLRGRLVLDGFDARDAEGQPVYAASQTVVNLAGGFDPDGQVAVVDELRIESDDGSAAFSGRVHLARLDDVASDWPGLVLDPRVEVQTPFLTLRGTGSSLGEFDAAGNADATRFFERFPTAGGGYTAAGVAEISMTTRQGLTPQGPGVTAGLDVSGRSLRLMAPPGDAAPARPLAFDRFRLAVNTTLARGTGDDDAGRGITGLRVDASADAGGGQVFQLVAVADGVTPEGDVGRLTLTRLAIPDVTRTRRALEGWAELPEFETSPGEMNVVGTLAWVGGRLQIDPASPVVVNVTNAETARVWGSAASDDDGTWTLDGLHLAVDDVARLDRVTSAMGTPLGGATAAAGAVVVAVDGTYHADRGLDVRATADCRDVSVRGMTLVGQIPVTAAGTTDALVIAVPPDAAGVTANGGTLNLAGASYDLGRDRLRWPQAELMAAGVSLNPVLLDFFGQFVNPAFVRAAEAGGLLDVAMTEPLDLNLDDPLGPQGGTLALRFSIRQMRIRNDVIREVADPLVSRLNGIPTVNVDFPQGGDLIRGEIVGATVRLVNGRTSVDTTFNLADPRLPAGAGVGARDLGELYPVRVSGSVNVGNLSQDLNVSVPRNLLDKWFGEQAWLRAFPNGFQVRLTGTTTSPRLEVGDLIDRAAREMIRGGVQDGVRDTIRDRLRGLRGE